MLGQELPWPSESPFQDSYGYSWQTNSAPAGPVFDWIDIEGIGIEITGLEDENTLGPLSIGMCFPFYWETFDEIWIGANGFVSLGSGVPISPSASGFPLLPHALLPNHVLAPFMADLTGIGDNHPGSVWVHADSQNQRFIVSWIDWPYASSQVPFFMGANTFQLILNGVDSSIVFQYLSMDSNWDPAYDGVPYPFIVGIENQSGNMGLMPTGVPISAQVLPVDSSAVRFVRPTEARIPIPDVEILWAENPRNLAVFLPWSPPTSTAWRPGHRLDTYIRNAGLEDIQQPFRIQNWVKASDGGVVFSRNRSISSLDRSEEQYIQVYDHFDAPHAGTYTHQSFIVQSSAYGDLNPMNDSMSVEFIVLDTSMHDHRLSYEQTTIQSPLFLYRGNEAAVWFEPYGYPVSVHSLEFNMFLSAGSGPQTGFYARIYQYDEQQLPGVLLFETFVPLANVVLPTGWTSVEVPEAIPIDSGGFLVSWEKVALGLNLLTDREAPFSRRGFDVVNDQWRPALNGFQEDLMIRAVVDHADAIPVVGVEGIQDNPIQLQIFPNPTSDLVMVQIDNPQAERMELSLLDMKGQVLRKEVSLPRTSIIFSWELFDIPTGIYLLQLKTAKQSRSQKLVIRD